MKTRTKKPREQAAEVASISMPTFLLEMARGRVRERGYSGLSEYIKDLVRKDACLAA